MAVENSFFDFHSLPAETKDDVIELGKVCERIYESWNTSIPTTNPYLLNADVATSFTEPDENYTYFVNFIEYGANDIAKDYFISTGSYWFFKDERPYITREIASDGTIKYTLYQGGLYPQCSQYNGISPDDLVSLYTRYNEYRDSYSQGYPKRLLQQGCSISLDARASWINHSPRRYSFYGNDPSSRYPSNALYTSMFKGSVQEAIANLYGSYGTYYFYYLSSFFEWYDSHTNGNDIVKTKFDTNIPIFDIGDPDVWNKIARYLIRGDRSGEIIITNSVDYTLYIDGDRLPNYNLNWNPDGLGKFSKDAKVHLDFSCLSRHPLDPMYEHFILKNFPFTDGSIKFNWSDIWQEIDAKLPVIDNILNNKFKVEINAVIDNGNVHIVKDKVSVDLHEKKNLSGELYENLVSPSSTGDTLTIDFGEGKDTDDYYDTDSGENDEHSPTTGYDIGACNLTACYELSVERLNNIAIKLWSEDFFNNILLLNNSPIENILSCKLLPLSLSGSESTVKIGNVDMGINGNRLSKTVYRYNIGTITIPRVNNMGFLNYAPYTSTVIFLPFIGFKELNTSDIMGRNVSVDYVVDVITGACKAIITVNNYQCYEFDGNCGIDIPLTAGNRSQVEMGYVKSAVGVASNIFGKHPSFFGAVNSGISGAMQQYHYSTNGSYSPSTGAYEDRTCFIIIDRPQYTEVSKFGHTKGYKCQLSKTIGSLKGFVKTTENVDLSNISAPEYCKKKILDLLSSGIYV